MPVQYEDGQPFVCIDTTQIYARNDARFSDLNDKLKELCDCDGCSYTKEDGLEEVEERREAVREGCAIPHTMQGGATLARAESPAGRQTPSPPAPHDAVRSLHVASRTPNDSRLLAAPPLSPPPLAAPLAGLPRPAGAPAGLAACFRRRLSP